MFMALILPDKSGRNSIFPLVPYKLERKNVMKTLKQLLFAMTIVIGVSMTASAQKDSDKKPPPKPNPPVIVVEPKKPKEEKPKNDDKRKKPEAFMSNFRYE